MNISSKNKRLSISLCSTLLLLTAQSFLTTGCNSDTIESMRSIAAGGGGGTGVVLDPFNPQIIPGEKYAADPVSLTAAWANDGGDKVARHELRGTNNPTGVANTTWSGQKVQLFGAKNEVVSFNLVLEAGRAAANGVQVHFNALNGPDGAKIGSTDTSGDGVFDYTSRDIELFYVRYLQIKGLSKFGYEVYDERHIPQKLQRPNGTGGWADRPNHDAYYPDIAVPMEAQKQFNIAQGQNQSVWVDVYIPKGVPSGTYQGAVVVTEGTHTSYNVPVELKVQRFTLPDSPSSKTMLNIGDSDLNKRYVGQQWPSDAASIAKMKQIRDRHFMMAHRHKISLIDSNTGTDGSDRPSDQWIPRLNGSLFTAANGYRGPGENTGNNIFSVGTYGSWGWKDQGQAGMTNHATAWKNWFASNSPNTEAFLYLIDESSDFGSINTWVNQLANAGNPLNGMVTLPLPSAQDNVPGLRVVTSTMDVGDTARWDAALAARRANGNNRFFMYNGKRPASGSFMTDDDGVALREIPWGQWKKGVDRWFYWESTYYTDFQSGRGDIDVMNTAQTFGPNGSYDNVRGMTSGTYSNGDGVLFYPGTDKVFPNSNYGLNGPIASLRLKHWRRGIQDVDYITMAYQKNPSATRAIVNGLVKSVLWENGVADRNDPTWQKCDMGWSNNPNDWENARQALVNIIEG